MCPNVIRTYVHTYIHTYFFNSYGLFVDIGAKKDGLVHIKGFEKKYSHHKASLLCLIQKLVFRRFSRLFCPRLEKVVQGGGRFGCMDQVYQCQ